MRTLTAPATLVTGRTYAAPVLLVTLTTVSGTVFKLSDYNRVIEGVEYVGLIQNPEDLTEKLNDFDGGGAPATARLALFNAAPIGGKARFSDLIRTPRNLIGTYDFRNARVDIDRLESGQALADVVRLQSFYLEAPDDIGDNLITLQMSDLALKIEDALPITKVAKAMFPKAPPSSLQQDIRRPFGVLKNVKALPVRDGAAGTLAIALTNVATTITLTDASDFSTAGTGVIEAEFVTWIGKAGDVLTGVTRGAQTTAAVAHDAGMDVLEALSEYVFAIGEGADHLVGGGTEALPITAISNVRVNGRVARTSPTATPDDLLLVSGRRFATIRFAPANVKLFHLLPQGEGEKLTVAALTVTGDGATHLQAVRTITPTAGVAEVTTRTRRTISWTVATPTAFTNTNDWTLIRRPPNGNGTTDVIIGQGQGAAGNTAGDTWSGTDSREYANEGTETILFQALLGSAKDIVCTFNDVEIVHPEGAGGSGESTSAACIGEVVCDVQGLKDDTLGSFTGHSGRLFENPTDVTAVILQALYRLSVADFDASWGVTQAIHATAGYKWAGLLGALQFSDLRRRLSEQARARLVLTSGKIGFRFRSYRPSADVTFQYDPVGGRTGLAQDLTIKLTSPTEMVAGLTVRYAFDDAKGEYQKSVTFGDVAAAAAAPPMEFPFISDDTTARDLGAYWFGLRGRQRFSVDGTAWHNALALEQGDHFAVKGHAAMVAHGDDALIFGVLRKADKGSQDGIGKIALGGLEDTIEGDVGPEDTSMAWGSRGLQAKNNAATPTTKIDASAAAIVLRNSSNLIVVRHSPGSVTCDVSVSGPIVNGRDQSGVFSTGWVHFYWIWDATNGLLGSIASAAAPPTGPSISSLAPYTYWSYIGAYYFSASALIRTTICGSWASRQNVEALAAAVTDNTEHSIDGTAIWPPNAMRIGGSWGAILSVAGDSADLRPESGVDSGPHLETPGATTTGFGGGFRMNVTGQTIWYIQSANASRVWRVEINEYELPNGGA